MAMSEGTYTIRTEGVLNVCTYAIGLIGFLSVVRYVGIPFSAGFICIFAAALYFDYRRRYDISRSALNIALVIFIVLNSLRISIDDMATPVVETLLILIAVKLFEEKKARDYMQVYLLAVFLLTGSALLSIDMQFLLMLTILAFLLPVTIVLLTFHSQQGNMTLTNRELRSIVSRALVIALVSIPATIFLFVTLPRTGFPIFNIISKSGASTGFTDSVRLGEISDIQENNAVILRVETEKLDNRMLYWRGVVLDQFDGVSWKSMGREQRQKQQQQHHGEINLSGRKAFQVVYIEPYGNKYLFALDKPSSIYLRNAAISDDLTIKTRLNVERLTRYGVLSLVSDVYAQTSIDRAKYLQLPNRDFSRIKELVSALSAGKKEEEVASSILTYLRTGGYSYSLQNLPVTRNPVEDFLFTYKYGNCEYFASSMAVMLRLAGIPARLVGGYLGGQYNDFGRYYIVTQNSAHVWVEAYIDGKGWTRLDPTPTIAGSVAGTGPRSLLQNLGLLMDLINYYWNIMIIDYNLDKQVSIYIGVTNLLKYSFSGSLSFKQIVPGAALVFALIVLLVLARYHGLLRKTAEKKLVNRFVARMLKHGYQRMPHEGLEEFSGKVTDPVLREKTMKFAASFDAVFYSRRKMTREDRLILHRLIDDI
jgi:protein-glutamine gamma-glutamyltransferase